jgi:hypothetical protein
VKRLPYRLPEWAPRVIYVSAHAREVWQPRISAISNAWIEAERDSVAAGIRKSALQHVSPDRLPELLREEAARGLLVLPLGQVPKVTGYQSATKELKPGQAFDYKVAITRAEHAAEWTEAWQRSDDRAIGRLLSTPECCVEAFQKYWVEERWMDLTWPTHQHETETDGYNGLLRWLGVRGVSHLPCSPTCVETNMMYSNLLEVMKAPEDGWLHEMLSWPTLWTSLNGIAEITNPVLRMSVPTDPLMEKVEVRFMGWGYPDEGASGKVFPFSLRPEKALSQKSENNPADNGFKTQLAQDAAHAVLLGLVNGHYGTVLDLGCGDGTLLRKIRCKRRVGIESDPARAAKAQIDRVVVSNCQDPAVLYKVIGEEKPDLIIAQRDRNPANTLTAPNILSYSYEGNIEAELICQTS